MKRLEAIEFIKSQGGDVQPRVTKKTTALIVGHERGDVKYNDAMKKGVPILPFPMLITLGWWEERGDFVGWWDEKLYSDLLFQMTVTLDNVYAHLISEPSPELERAFLVGAAGIERLLSAAWRPTVECSPRRDKDKSANPNETNRLLREGIAGWTAMVRFLERVVEG